MKRKAIITALLIGAFAALTVGIASHFVQFNAYLWGHDFAASSLSFACWEPGRLRIEIMANEPTPLPDKCHLDAGLLRCESGLTHSGAISTSLGVVRYSWYRDYIVSIRLWPLVGLLAAYPAITLIRGRFRSRPSPKSLCVKCGYNLTGNVSGVCPECGTRLAPVPTDATNLPDEER